MCVSVIINGRDSWYMLRLIDTMLGRTQWCSEISRVIAQALAESVRTQQGGDLTEGPLKEIQESNDE
jgi:hypothetical protein